MVLLVLRICARQTVTTVCEGNDEKRKVMTSVKVWSPCRLYGQNVRRWPDSGRPTKIMIMSEVNKRVDSKVKNSPR